MTSLINLLIASFLAMNPAPTQAQAATAGLAAPPAANGAGSQQACTREPFGKACKSMKQAPKYDAPMLAASAALQPKQVR